MSGLSGPLRQVLLQLLKRVARFASPLQSAPNPLWQQFNAIAVNCLANCRLIFPAGLTQIASTAEDASSNKVFVIASPQTSRQLSQ
jgi:hypothetical protein